MTTPETSPKRIQRRRTRGWRMPESAVYVGRPTKWGNPYPVSRAEAFHRVCSIEELREMVVDFYAEYLDDNPDLATAARRELRGQDLACWCPLDQPCHADVLLEVANTEAEVQCGD